MWAGPFSGKGLGVVHSLQGSSEHTCTTQLAGYPVWDTE